MLSFIDGFLPKVGDAFDFFDLSGVHLLGGFYRVMITGALGFGFDPALLGQGIVGVIEGDSVSEPASLALVPLGVLGLGGCAGRCRSVLSVAALSASAVVLAWDCAVKRRFKRT